MKEERKTVLVVEEFYLTVTLYVVVGIIIKMALDEVMELAYNKKKQSIRKIYSKLTPENKSNCKLCHRIMSVVPLSGEARKE